MRDAPPVHKQVLALAAGFAVGAVLTWAVDTASGAPAPPPDTPSWVYEPAQGQGWKRIMAEARLMLASVGLPPQTRAFRYGSSPVVDFIHAADGVHRLGAPGDVSMIVVSPEVREHLARAERLRRWHNRTGKRPELHWLPWDKHVSAALHEHAHAAGLCASEGLVEAIAVDLTPAFTYRLYGVGGPMSILDVPPAYRGGYRKARRISAVRAGVRSGDHPLARIERRRMLDEKRCGVWGVQGR